MQQNERTLAISLCRLLMLLALIDGVFARRYLFGQDHLTDEVGHSFMRNLRRAILTVHNLPTLSERI